MLVACTGSVADPVAGPDAAVPSRIDGSTVHVDASRDADAGAASHDASYVDAGVDAEIADAATVTDAADADSAVMPIVPGAAADALFADTGIARVGITLDAAAEAALRADPYTYVHGGLEVVLVDGRTLTFADVGVRVKGRWGSLRTLDQKTGFLIKADEYVPGQKLLSMKKLALNNMVQDPSLLHEQLAYALFRAADVPAPRTGYARVSVNDKLFGLYASVEVIDNAEFLDRWFGQDEGNLYEGAYGSDLEDGLLTSFDQDRGADVAYADLQALTDALDGFTTPESFVSDARTVIDMKRYYAFAATEIFIGHWDGYAWTRNNYFLYRGADSRWTFMPWGTDQTFAQDLDAFGGGGRVEQMCAASLACRAKLAAAFEDVVARAEDLDLVTRVDTLRALIEDAMQEDPRKESDANTVHGAMDATKAFLQTRASAITADLGCTDPADVDVDGDGASGCGADCNDGDIAVHPGAVEACNVADDDCDSVLDEEPSCPSCTEATATVGGTYAFCFKAKNFTDAESDCVTQGGHLVSVHSQTELDEIMTTATGLVASAWTVGLHDTATEGTFVWTDGSTLDFQAWSGGEPNDSGSVEDCAQVYGASPWPWNDISCDAVQPYVCKLP
jgi:CotH kinase protein/Lectin C-type domain/Putative metal-binding motif